MKFIMSCEPGVCFGRSAVSPVGICVLCDLLIYGITKRIFLHCRVNGHL